MTISALFVGGKQVLPAANDVPADSPYRARPHVIMPGGQTPFMRNKEAETLLFVEQGVVEVMINGGVHLVGRGESARITRGLIYAYRNAGSANARLYSAAIDPAEPNASALNVTVEIAA